MCFKHFLLLLVTYYIKIVLSQPRMAGWNYINLHCRDNDNRPVDWWYIYKPPAEIIPFRELGHDFIYITSDEAGRWQHSGRHITANSMLQNTEAPMFRPTYSDYLAVVAYEATTGNETNGNPSLGALMADQVGGVWIGHTVPGLTDWTKDRPLFPEKELAHGHLVVCLSLDLITVNQMARLIKQTSPRFSRIQIPPRLRALLPEWNFLEDSNSNKPQRHLKTDLKFLTKNKSLQTKMMIRKPGENFCPFTNFAKNMNLVLDVYGHRGHKLPLCFKNYSVRKIDRISMKSVEFVHYVNNKRDRSTFAVSTAATWQRKGKSGKDQYWTCTGPPDDNPRIGGILVCVDNYDVWQSFDNFKVKEPVC